MVHFASLVASIFLMVLNVTGSQPGPIYPSRADAAPIILFMTLKQHFNQTEGRLNNWATLPRAFSAPKSRQVRQKGLEEGCFCFSNYWFSSQLWFLGQTFFPSFSFSFNSDEIFLIAKGNHLEMDFSGSILATGKIRTHVCWVVRTDYHNTAPLPYFESILLCINQKILFLNIM